MDPVWGRGTAAHSASSASSGARPRGSVADPYGPPSPLPGDLQAKHRYSALAQQLGVELAQRRERQADDVLLFPVDGQRKLRARALDRVSA